MSQQHNGRKKLKPEKVKMSAFVAELMLSLDEEIVAAQSFCKFCDGPCRQIEEKNY